MYKLTKIINSIHVASTHVKNNTPGHWATPESHLIGIIFGTETFHYKMNKMD